MTTELDQFEPTVKDEPVPLLPLLGAMLAEQSMTAVDRFSQAHDAVGDAPADRYRDLIPLTSPAPGQQYAFEVDLDACSGCKACVAACHSLNGLEDGELWRQVGQLVGGGANEPSVVQHVTAACHHCVEPACLHGCPVEAYEKDALTGIVRHLDDQCIGCQYCVLKCPYDVPTYSHSKGIVRKCDMCHQRLAVGEAPACVQGCPNEAIRIRLVDTAGVLEDAEASSFLPAAPDSGYTAPTTVYKSERPLPRNSLPADYFAVHRSHGHLPLVVMLVLTQMSVGAFLVEQGAFSYVSLFRESMASSIRPLHLISALGLGLAGLTASIFHLGRPLYAFRALLGLRTSWLSREILAFGVFAGLSSAYVAAASLAGTALPWETALGGAAAASGVAAVFCSIMVYVDTRRPCWSFPLTAAKFALTTVVLGIPIALLVPLAACAGGELTVGHVMSGYGWTLCRLLVVAVLSKLAVEAAMLLHLWGRQHTPKKRSALLMTGDLGMVTLRRMFFGAVGGVVLPLLLLAEARVDGGYDPLFVGLISLLMLVLLTVGELHERYLFFAASVAARMPGAPAT